MATPDDVLEGVAAAMETAVSDLTTALNREADPTDNTVQFPHGDITTVSNNREDPWNTDVVGYATDDEGNNVGYLLDAKFEMELQCNVWIAVPSQDWDIQSLGRDLERGLRKYDINRRQPAPLPDGSGGVMSDVSNFRIVGGGTLPSETNFDSPLRGYRVTVNLRYTDRIDTSEEYGTLDYIESIDTNLTQPDGS